MSAPDTLVRDELLIDTRPCVGCGMGVDPVVLFEGGERICEPCARKVLNIFAANTTEGAGQKKGRG